MARKISVVPFEDDEIYLPETSALGTNAYYLEFCQYGGYRPSYASCICRIKDRKNGRLDTNYADCSAAIGKKECPAIRMLKEEADAGMALYYVNREKMRENQRVNAELLGVKLGQRAARELSLPSQKRHLSSEVRVEPSYSPTGTAPQQTHSPVTKKGTSPESGSEYADAINKHLRTLSRSEKEPTLSTSEDRVNLKNEVSANLSLDLKPGMSLLEIAKAKRSQTTPL